MRTVTEAVAQNRGEPLFVCDFSPPRSGAPGALDAAARLEADFVCVAYNPGKAVRVDAAAAAFEINRATGRDVIFNLSPRDMNKLALQSRLLGAQLLGLSNVLVLQGDPITERDATASVGEYTASGLIGSIRELNEGNDYRGSRLRNPTAFCIGAAADLGRGVEQEAALARRKVEAGAEFLLTQPVWHPSEIDAFAEAYERVGREKLSVPMFWGLQVLVAEGVIFSSVPESVRGQLSNGRDGVEIAIETYRALREGGVNLFYLVAPILRGGARDYEAAQRFLQAARAA